MKELSNHEVIDVNGGIAPVVWFAAGLIARSAIGTAIRSTVKTAAQGFIGGATGAGLKASSNS